MTEPGVHRDIHPYEESAHLWVLFTCFDILIFEVIAKLFQICFPSLDGRGLRDGLNCNMLMSWTPPL